MDFTENRFRGYCDRVLSGDILCETGNEDETCFQRHTGWYPDHASGTSPNSGRFLGSCDLDHFICDRCGDQYRFR